MQSIENTPESEKPGNDDQILNESGATHNPETDPAKEAGRYLMADQTPVTPEEAQEALELLVQAGFAAEKLASTFGIPVTNVPDIVVKNAKNTGREFIPVVEETIRESVANELEVFQYDLSSVIGEANPEILSIIMMEASMVMMDLPGLSETATEEEVSAASEALTTAGVDLQRASMVYGLLPSRVAEYFARSVKGLSFVDTVEGKIEDARQGDYPIFREEPKTS